jgi:signal transduction histidine kinase/DNA-binding NarL/FixJ family response regulator
VLWLSTNRGLSRFTPSTGVARNYDETDGLQSREFNQGAAHASADGEMFFGGINGLNGFDPEAIPDSRYVAPVVITEFYLFNEPVAPGPDSALQAPIAASDSIRLTYRDDFFAFEFASLHYSDPGSNRYSYKLDGLDRNWNDVGTRNFAGYTSVPPGEYVFRVRGTNSDGVWNEDGAAIAIFIQPPYWETWWFRLLAGLLGTGLVAGAVVLRVRSVDARRRALERQVTERTVELREALGEVGRARDAAEAANRAKSAFLANVSHELRTPLNAILGFSQLMMRSANLGPPEGPRLSADQVENLEVISHSGEHLLGLINDVLEMSKIEAGRATLNELDFDLYRLIDGLEEMFRLRAEGKGLDLGCERDASLPRYLRADQGRLRQILMNLLGNAVKFTERGSVTARCSAVVEPDSSLRGLVRLRFEVQDTGPGIAPDELEAIFDPFVQTASGQDMQEGTGLGLAISREFARLMGGDLMVRSTLGQGSTFCLEIPAEISPEGAQPLQQLERQIIGLAPDQPPFRLLIVDDKQVNRRLLVKLLSPLGFATREAADGEQAVEIWETWEPHLIFMDMRMPVVDGYEATRRIKATTRGQATVIVALTASALEEDRLVILSEGCDAYIRKPFREHELFDVLAKHLGVRYIYAEEAAVEPAGGLPTAQEQASLRSLASMPADWRKRLRRATVIGDLEQIGAAIDATGDSELEPEQATILANTLRDLAGEFEHDRILALIDQAEAPGE